MYFGIAGNVAPPAATASAPPTSFPEKSYSPRRSRDLAELVQQHLIEGVRELHPGAQDMGVKRAKFQVLLEATMPSVLTEISFLTNEREAALLSTDEYLDPRSRMRCFNRSSSINRLSRCPPV